MVLQAIAPKKVCAARSNNVAAVLTCDTVQRCQPLAPLSLLHTQHRAPPFYSTHLAIKPENRLNSWHGCHTSSGNSCSTDSPDSMSASSSISRPACARATCCQEGAPRLFAAAAAAATAASAAAAAGVSDADGVGVAALRQDTQPAGSSGQRTDCPVDHKWCPSSARMLCGPLSEMTVGGNLPAPQPEWSAVHCCRCKAGAWQRRAWLVVGPHH